MNQCTHGSWVSVCEICKLRAENAQLKAERVEREDYIKTLMEMLSKRKGEKL